MVSTAVADPLLGTAASFSEKHPAVVRVAVPERDGASYGSGSLVAVNESSGLVLTNWHVVRDAAGPIVVYFPDGFHSVAYLLRTDRDWDLAALAIRRPNAQPIRIALEAPRPGDRLTIAGYGSGPYRTVSGQCMQYLSPGENQPYEIIEMTTAARDGDSGGPILNSRGELAGVLFGSAFDRTSGSYCGRVRWFLASADNDFRRISAQALLAQQARRQQQQQLLTNNSAGPLAGEGPGVRAADSSQGNANRAASPHPNPLPEGEGTKANSAGPLVGEGSGARADGIAKNSPSSPLLSDLPPLIPVPPLGNRTTATPTAAHASLPTAMPPTAAIPAALSRPVPSGGRIETFFAAIGVIAVLYHAMRLLGRAVG